MSPRIALRKIDVAGTRRRLLAASSTAPRPEDASSGTARPATADDPDSAPGTPGAPTSDGQPLRLTVLGGSEATGAGCERADQTLAARLAQALAEREGRPVTWRVVAEDGATADDCTTRLVERLHDGPTDLVVLLVGVDDLVAGTRPALFARDLEGLVNRTRAAAPDAPVLLSGLPSLGGLPLAPRLASLPVLPGLLDRVNVAHAEAFDHRIADAARRHRLTFVDASGVRPATGELGARGLRPAAATSEAWARALADAVPGPLSPAPARG